MKVTVCAKVSFSFEDENGKWTTRDNFKAHHCIRPMGQKKKKRGRPSKAKRALLTQWEMFSSLVRVCRLWGNIFSCSYIFYSREFFFVPCDVYDIAWILLFYCEYIKFRVEILFSRATFFFRGKRVYFSRDCQLFSRAEKYTPTKTRSSNTI